MTLIDRPVFIVGMPRSGSTAFHRVLAQHPAVATTTHVTRKAPTVYPALKLISLFVRNHQPGEAGSMWDKFVGPDDDVLRAADATPEARRYYATAVANVLRLYERPRFVSKCPRNGLRMEFLQAIFPDALFVHLVRDGRAVCRSVLERRKSAGDLRRWWDVKPPGWRTWEREEPAVSTAHQWREVVKLVRDSGATLPAGQFLEIRYEDFTRAPVETLRTVCAFAAMPWTEDGLRAATRDVESRNDKWEKAFSADDIVKMNHVMDDMLRVYGYL